MDSGESRWEDSGTGGEALLLTHWPSFTPRVGPWTQGGTLWEFQREGTSGWQMLAQPKRLVLSSCSLPLPGQQPWEMPLAPDPSWSHQGIPLEPTCGPWSCAVPTEGPGRCS